MNILRNLLTSLIKSIKKIKLVDRCLMIFMIILMTQSIYNLFFNEIISHNSDEIDIIIRTTSAAIFGYFLSGNFMRRSKSKSTNNSKGTENLYKRSMLSNDEKIVDLNKNDIEELRYDEVNTSFDNIDNKENITREYDNKNTIEQNENSQQIIIATIIGVTALIVIIIARNFFTLTETSLATISQMRDFVSGCVGFLLGCPLKRIN